jgi:hypothetical protein
MNDVPSLARQARANLSQALNALQDDNVPPHTQALASIVAEAMNLLHRIEKNHAVETFDLSDHSMRALLLVRNALNNLQAPENSHPSTETVLEPAALAVGLVHRLNTLCVNGANASSAVGTAKTDPAPPAASTPAASVAARPVPTAVPVSTTPASRPVNSETKQNAATTEAAGAEAEVVSPSLQQASTPAFASFESGSASTPDESPPSEKPTAPTERTSSIPERISTLPTALPALAPLPGEVYIEVSLGAYSTSNFYQHEVNTDVIDNGGLFVASYTPPELSQNVRVRATLSGGFEFEGRGTVEWRREMPKSGSLNPLTPPGFGLKFTELSEAARKMVLRYSRSREPFVRELDAP